jgi:hypothetical protein
VHGAGEGDEDGEDEAGEDEAGENEAGEDEVVTAGYFYDTFADEICFYGIYFYGIYIYGIYLYRASKFISINCTVVRNT